MGRNRIELVGFREASSQLNSMKKAMRRGVGARALLIPAGILADGMRDAAPVLTGALKASIVVEKSKARKGRPRVETIAKDVASVATEFGTSRQAAQPWARPAKEAKQREMLAAFGEALKVEADAALSRQAARAAKRAAKG